MAKGAGQESAGRGGVHSEGMEVTAAQEDEESVRNVSMTRDTVERTLRAQSGTTKGMVYP